MGKLGMAGHVCHSSCGGQSGGERKILGAHWKASLAETKWFWTETVFQKTRWKHTLVTGDGKNELIMTRKYLSYSLAFIVLEGAVQAAGGKRVINNLIQL